MIVEFLKSRLCFRFVFVEGVVLCVWWGGGCIAWMQENVVFTKNNV